MDKKYMLTLDSYACSVNNTYYHEMADTVPNAMRRMKKLLESKKITMHIDDTIPVKIYSVWISEQTAGGHYVTVLRSPDGVRWSLCENSDSFPRFGNMLGVPILQISDIFKEEEGECERNKENIKVNQDAWYNGFENYQTWNVTFSIQNDPILLNRAIRYMANESELRGCYLQFCKENRLDKNNSCTEDGVWWVGPQLDYEALDKWMWGLKEEIADEEEEY